MEFKECKEGLSQNLWETVSAFSNTQGGWLILGVSDGGELVGVTNAEKRVKELFDLGRNSQKISTEVWNENDVSTDSSYGCELVVVRVRAAPRTKRPVYLNNNPMTGTFVRRNESDYRCTPEEVKRMFRESSEEAIDSTILSEFGLDSLNLQSVIRYRQRLQNRSPEHEFNHYGQQRFLIALDAVDSACKHPTVGGLLMFGTQPALHRWRKRHLIDYRRNPTSVNDTRWDDRLVWDANLFDAYFMIYSKLTDGISVPHRIEGGERIEETPTHIALREALVNLLVHADYSETGASLLTRAPDGYYFRNPGSSRVAGDDLFIGNRSDPRNPSLIVMFRLIGLAEEAGTGLPSIVRAWRSMGFQVPNLEIGTERYEFGLMLRNAHLFSDVDRTWLQRLGCELSEAEQLALVYGRNERRIDNVRLRTLAQIHAWDATEVLTGLRDKGLLKKEKDRRGAYYQVPQSLSEIDDSNVPTLFDQRMMTDAGSDLIAKRENLRVENEILREIRKKLRQRLSRTEKGEFISHCIVRLCSLRPFVSTELAKAFEMSPANLVTRYLNALIRDGQLQWTGTNRNDRTGKYLAILKTNGKK